MKFCFLKSSMILSDADIIELIKTKRLLISPPPKRKDITTVHVDLYLSDRILKYKKGIADIKDESTFDLEEILISKSGYKLKSDEFVLGSTVEWISIPNGYFGYIEAKGNIARAGIQVHNTDGHIDPGFEGNVTLEIKNNSNRPIIVYPNIPFVHLYIFKVSSESRRPYDGVYQHQIGPTSYRKD